MQFGIAEERGNKVGCKKWATGWLPGDCRVMETGERFKGNTQYAFASCIKSRLMRIARTFSERYEQDKRITYASLFIVPLRFSDCFASKDEKEIFLRAATGRRSAR